MTWLWPRVALAARRRRGTVVSAHGTGICCRSGEQIFRWPQPRHRARRRTIRRPAPFGEAMPAGAALAHALRCPLTASPVVHGSHHMTKLYPSLAVTAAVATVVAAANPAQAAFKIEEATIATLHAALKTGEVT